MKKFVIFDTHAVVHRAYHAIPPLSTKEGVVVNAVYGFTNILLKVLREVKPDYVACAMDLPGKTFRHQEYAEYKATRQKADDDLVSQFPLVVEIIDSLNIPLFTKEGYEADDVIGSLSRMIGDDIEVYIVTGDMDELQLVTETTKIYTMKRGFSDTVIYDLKMMKEKYGLTPSEFIDYKALKGDPSDNIPGVPGIGEKTATALIIDNHNLEGIYSNIESLKPRIREKLEEFKDQAYLSRKLSTIITDIKLDLNIEDAKVHDFDRDKATDLFLKLGFKSLVDKLPKGSQAGEEKISTKQAINGKYNIISRREELDQLILKIKKAGLVSVDTETTGLDSLDAELVGLCLAVEAGVGYYVPVGHMSKISKSKFPISNKLENSNYKNDLFGESGEKARKLEDGQLELDYVIQKMKSILEDDNIHKIGHNIKYDYKVLEKYGIKISPLFFDTMIATYLTDKNAGSKKLDDLALSELGVRMIPIAELIGKGKDQINFSETNISEASNYAAEDADITLRLYEHFAPQIKKEGFEDLFYNIEMPIVRVLAEMEVCGVKIDPDRLNKMSGQFSKKIDDLTKEIWKISGTNFNIASPAQLKEVLFDKLKLAENPEISKVLKKVKSGGFSTAAGELDKLRGLHPIIDLITEYREIAKLKSTYVDTLPLLINKRTGRVHTSYNQTVAATGRLSSTNPNLQNIPIRTELGNEIRKAFVAEKGYKLLAADYSQIELRMVAHIAEDKEMLRAFNEGEDIHTRTAALVFGVKNDEVTADMRRIAKVVNFGVLYGMSPHGLSVATGMERTEAKEFIDKYFEAHKGIASYIEKTKESAKEHGYVESPFGRKRYVPEINSSNFMVKSGAERVAVNMPVQGGAADIMKMAMINISSQLPVVSSQARMLLQVHDELIFEVPEADIKKVADLVKQEMENVVKLKVPVEVKMEVGDNWGEMEEYKI